MLLFCLTAFAGFSQTTDRYLYEYYFKRLYTYEPAMMRENKIDSLEVVSFEKRGDEVTYRGRKEQISFRQDGRPIRQINRADYGKDSTVSDYSYDRLGNLVEFRRWIPKRISYQEDRVLERQFYQYESNQLVKVFSYAMVDGNNYLTLRFCDSLSYSPDLQKVTIIHGNADGSKVIFNKTPKFSYPFKAQNNTIFTATEKNRSDKPVDKESYWSVSCTYSNPELKEIQSRMKTTCLNPSVVQSFYMLQSKKALKITYDRAAFGLSADAFFIDTLEQRLFVKSEHHFRQPTSLEDRVAHTHSTDRYNFQMQLLITESIRESSRGQREHSRDSSQTFYFYFDFGLLQRKLQYIYPSSVHREILYTDQTVFTVFEELKNEPVVIFEDKVIIKQRD